jgi:hypothetical protein
MRCSSSSSSARGQQQQQQLAASYYIHVRSSSSTACHKPKTMLPLTTQQNEEGRPRTTKILRGGRMLVTNRIFGG